MQQSLASVVALASLCQLLSGCSSHPPKSSATSAPLPRSTQPASSSAADSAPYWCDLVSKRAFRHITGLKENNLSEYRSGWQPSHGTCLVRNGRPTSPLGLNWSTGNGAKTVHRMKNLYDLRFGPTKLPAVLGRGFTVKTTAAEGERPYYVIATFQCGSIRPWLSIDILQISPGRDATKDLVDLMRLAQQRFGKLHRCVPGSS